jgi:hypothetical protein
MIATQTVGPEQYGYVEILRVFRCTCGRLCAMGHYQENAAILHETPQCNTYASLETKVQCLLYFYGLTRVPLTEAVAQQLTRNQAHA